MGLIRHRKDENIFFSWGFYILNKWLQIKNEGGSLKLYFKDNCLSDVAIYGGGAIGRRLYEELCLEKVEVKYFIDQNAKNIHIQGVDVKTLEEKLPKVDAVIVTPIAFYEIEKNIRSRMGDEVAVISIEDIVDYCFGY